MLGSLPDYPYWLTSDVPPPSPGQLVECAQCRLRFRSPIPSPAALLRQYEALESGELWAHGERRVWRDIRTLLDRAPNRRVLDVGCFRGDFLDWLGPTWERFGLEPALEAGRIAQSRGVSVLGPTTTALDGRGVSYGAITLIDVLEHVAEPFDMLKRLVGSLAPGGRLIVFTGSTDALSWRLVGLDYWYSAIPDHVAFFCPRWFDWAAPSLGATVVSVRRLPYRSASIVHRADEALKNALFAAQRRLARRGLLEGPLGRLPLLKRISAWKIAWWTTATDHLLVCLEKTP